MCSFLERQYNKIVGDEFGIPEYNRYCRYLQAGSSFERFADVVRTWSEESEPVIALRVSRGVHLRTTRLCPRLIDSS